MGRKPRTERCKLLFAQGLHARGRRFELNFVAAHGREVELIPGDDLGRRQPREDIETEATQQRRGTDVDPFDRCSLLMERVRAGDDDEEPDNSGHHLIGDDIDPFVAQVRHRELLVGRVRLDEREPPGSQRRPDGRRDGEVTGLRRRHARHEQTVGGGSPIRPCHERGDDV
jgi:hypothetical protein